LLGRINYSSAGHGSSVHLTGELFRARAGIDIVRKLNADINRILQSPDVRERLTALGDAGIRID
jgi:tripartite-type tricarboxylate transporter receptor subunit TctC